MARDPVAARQCAFIEADHPQADAEVFSGRTILMMIYANGLGVARNLDVAIHLACGLEGAPMESHLRVMHLESLRAAPAAAAPFDYCNDVTSGLKEGNCAALEAEISSVRRNRVIAALTVRFSPAEREAFDRLQQAMNTFAQAYSRGETDLSGSARGAEIAQADSDVRDEFRGMLDRLASGQVPRATAADAAAADARLNALYDDLRRNGVRDRGSVTFAGIQASQRAWLRYRDAFIRFAALAYPAVGRDSLVAWMTTSRNESLEPSDD
jgi:uncharacterized protein YecT (DUF1311 family)